MNKPDLSSLIQWIGTELIETIDKERRNRKEIIRDRKLGTIQVLWLFLAVAINSGKRNLDEIVQQAVNDLGVQWTLTVAAFCKARARFSPPIFANHLWKPSC